MDAPSSTEDRERRLFLVGFLQGLSARIENIEWSHAHDSIVADIDVDALVLAIVHRDAQ